MTAPAKPPADTSWIKGTTVSELTIDQPHERLLAVQAWVAICRDLLLIFLLGGLCVAAFRVGFLGMPLVVRG